MIPITLPPDAFECVRHAHIRIHIVKSSSSNRKLTQSSVIQQLGLLPFLVNVQQVTLSFRIYASLGTTPSVPSLPLLQPSLRALSTIWARSSLNIAVCIESAKAGADTTAAHYLAHCLEPFEAVSVTSLRLKNEHSDMSDTGDSQMQEASEVFRQVVCHVNKLHIDGFDWLFFDSGPFVMPELKELGLKMSNLGEDAQQCLQNLCQTIDAGSRLEKLSLGIRSPDDFIWPSSPPRTLTCSRLQQLSLSDGVLDFFMPALATLPCRTVSLAMRNGDELEWTRLLSVLRDKQYWPHLRQLELDYEAFYEDYYPSHAPPYHLLRNAAEVRNVAIDIQFTSEEPGDPVHVLMAHLRAMQGDLIGLNCRVPREDFDSLLAYRQTDPILLSKVKTLSWNIYDDADNIEAPGDQAFAALMRLFSAPQAKEIKLYCSSPFSGSLAALVEALKRGAYPALRSIAAHFYSDERWDLAVKSSRKHAFFRICKELGISTEECMWL